MFRRITMALTMLMPVTIPAAFKGASSAADAPGVFTFTVIGDIPNHAKDVALMRALLGAIDAEYPIFVVHLGNSKGRDEACSDTLFETRHNLPNSLIAPVVYILGDHDWSDCQRPTAGSFDPVERLLRLRELLYPDDNTFDQRTMTATYQSGQVKLRSYREDMRWAMNDVLFVTLNAPNDNNGHETVGGRNGEYEDRLKANRRWLARVLAVAHQRKVTGVVIMIQADPLFEDGWEWCCAPNLFDGLPCCRSYDSYLTPKHQMRSSTHDYDGAILLIHGASQTSIFDRPLKDEDGCPDVHAMHICTYGPSALDCWLEVPVMSGRMSLLYVRNRCLDSMLAPMPEIAPTPA